MNKHTEGPWGSRRTRGNNHFEYSLLRSLGGIPGQFASIEFSNSETAEANAKLIAAAPMLLAACEQAMAAATHADAPWWMDCPDRGGIDIDALEIAIQSATN